MHLAQLPLTPNGKVDRKALPDPSDSISTGAVFVAAETEMDKKILRIWAQTLGIKAESIGMADDFFVLGGNSLKAISLLGQIQNQFKTQIPVHILYQNPTPKGLSTYLDEVKTLPSLLDSHLISLQPNGSKTPLFIAPGIEGKSYYLFELANAMEKNQPVFGFQQVGLLEGEVPLETIEEIAVFNIHLMKKIQAHGPYKLAGHSMGGWVVMEMANQLQKQGESVEFLGLIDSYSPKVLAGLGGFPIYFQEQGLNDLLLLVDRLVENQVKNLDYEDLREKLSQTASTKGASLVHHWAVQHALIPESFSKDELERWAMLIGTNSRISYKPKKSTQAITLFKAALNELEDFTIPYCLGWSAKVKSNFRIMITPGNHFNMMQYPHVGFLAKAIQECLAGTEIESEYLIKA
jgi:thioesterase domain-containing protein/acyl carrier protein